MMYTLENIFKALGDQTRLRIINLLLSQELCVCEIVEALDLPQPRVSRHLGILKDAGLVLDRREAQLVYYRMNQGDPAVQLLRAPLGQLFSNEAGGQDGQRLSGVMAKRVDNICCPGIPRTSDCCKQNR